MNQDKFVNVFVPGWVGGRRQASQAGRQAKVSGWQHDRQEGGVAG